MQDRSQDANPANQSMLYVLIWFGNIDYILPGN